MSTYPRDKVTDVQRSDQNPTEGSNHCEQLKCRHSDTGWNKGFSLYVQRLAGRNEEAEAQEDLGQSQVENYLEVVMPLIRANPKWRISTSLFTLAWMKMKVVLNFSTQKK